MIFEREIYYMKTYKVAILDSGVKTDHPAFNEKEMNGYSLQVGTNKQVIKSNDFYDNNGHGTAIFYLIDKCTSDNKSHVVITNIKIHDKNNDISADDFECILNYIYTNGEFDIINISMGITNYGNIKNLQSICDKFHKKGTKLVSAFDNDGNVSFPAALQNVIGVDAQTLNIPHDQYIYIEGCIVNIVGKLRGIRVAWTDPDYIIVSGNSFLCAQVTSAIVCSTNFSVQGLSSSKIYFNRPNDNKPNYTIGKAAVFPFNKEIHALARFKDLLDFQLVDFYSSRISGQVGKTASQILPNCDCKSVIKDIANIDWKSFDTLILGHLDELSSISNADYKNELVSAALTNKKNIYSFDMIDNAHADIFTPTINSCNVRKKYGKLYKVDKPILSVIGTNSRQGKFTLQLLLRYKFIQRGYSVGQIGTEPSSLLFGMDEAFPSGYNRQVDLDIEQTYSVINQMTWDISQKNVDIIITGTQSGLLAYSDSNVFKLPLYNKLVFEAMKPDAIILCINIYDEVSFIKRTIRAAESLSNGKVIALVCFPVNAMSGWKWSLGRTIRITSEGENFIKRTCFENFGLNVYMLDNESEINELVDLCINFFTA